MILAESEGSSEFSTGSSPGKGQDFDVAEEPTMEFMTRDGYRTCRRCRPA